MKILIGNGVIQTMFSLKKTSSFLTLCIFSTFSISSQAEESTTLDLIHAQGCKGCHSIRGTGGTFAPSLDKIGQRLSRGQLRKKLIGPKKGDNSSLMPDSRHLTELEREILVDFLSALR